MKNNIIKAFITVTLLSSSLVGCNSKPDVFYEVIFKNYDNSTLYESKVKQGDTAVYQGSTPTRADDEGHKYVFKGWDKPLTNILEDTTFIAQYEVKNKYVVNFYNYDDTLLDSCTVVSGEAATYSKDTPSKPATLEYYYEFKCWDKDITNVTSNLNVKATYEEKYNISDYYFVSDCRVFQDAETFDEDTTSYVGYLKQIGFMADLKEGVEVDGQTKTFVIIDYDDESVKFDYSKVNLSKKGDYPFTVTVRGLTKESSIKVVTNTSKWTHIEDKPTHLYVYDPNLYGKTDRFKFYEDNNCILDSTLCGEFYPFKYEMASDNSYVIIRNEDGSIECKYSYDGDYINYYEITAVEHIVVGTMCDWVKLFTESDFTIVNSGYAYIASGLAGTPYNLTTKYEYNPETKKMKLFATTGFDSLTYNPETGELVYTE